MQDFFLCKKQKNGDSIVIQKSYEIAGLKKIAEILISKNPKLKLQIVDNTGSVLWKNKSNPELGVAQLKGE